MSHREPAVPAIDRTSFAFWILLGLAAGTWIALSDFGSGWLWMTTAPDRVFLLLRALALHVPLGGLLGAGMYGVERGVGRLRTAYPRLATPRFEALPWTALLTPALLVVAVLLFSGGKMSRLAIRPLGILVALVVLVVGTHGVATLGLRIARRAHRSPRDRLLVAGAFAAAFYVAAKLNQHAYPNLYEYLHVALSVAAFFAAVGALYAYLHPIRERSSVVRATRIAPWVGVVSVAVFVANLLSFEVHPNVRVALHESRTPHSRSLMHAVEPTIRALADRGVEFGVPRARAGAYTERTRRAWTGAPLVSLGGAHVLMITVDALRADHLGSYGYRRGLTPRLDAFARESVVFERAYSAAPHSSYSLSSLMTSEYLHEVVELDVPLPDATLAHVLGANGYYTAAFFTQGIFHTEGERLEVYKSNSFGFTRHQHDNPRCEQRTDQILAEVDRIVSEGEPSSFVWAHYFDTHEPYLDDSLGAGDMDRYDAEIRNVDHAVDRLIRETRSRLGRPVVVVITADHGEEFHEHGGVYHGSTLYDEQIRVPLIVSAEGISPRRVPEPVELVDVAPTLLSLVGVQPASTMRGEDLRPSMMGLGARSGNVHSAVTHKRMVVAYPFKLIADLRFDLYELYDLSNDAGERRNLAAAAPERVASLRADIYGWLDGIRANASRARDAWESAIDLGRLRDRRAVEPLSALVVAENAPTNPRIEAARLLGRFADVRARPALRRAMDSLDPLVAAEAAIALGRMFDPVAGEMLRNLVRSEDPGIRTRAGISLARIGDREAVPSLLETLRTSRDQYEREEAVRWLGRLGDAQAMEELIELLGDFRIRHLTVVSLGQLHDPRAFPPLLDVLSWERHATIRNNLVRGLGELGDPRATTTLVDLAWREPELDFASESLIRVRALSRSEIGGLDFDTRAGRRIRGLSNCTDEAEDFEWLYVGKTFCRLDGTTLGLAVRTPASLAAEEGNVLVLFRARSTDPRGSHVDVRVGDVDLGDIDLDTSMREHRFELPASALRSGTTQTRLTVEPNGAPIELDHLLILPHTRT